MGKARKGVREREVAVERRKASNGGWKGGIDELEVTLEFVLCWMGALHCPAPHAMGGWRATVGQATGSGCFRTSWPAQRDLAWRTSYTNTV